MYGLRFHGAQERNFLALGAMSLARADLRLVRLICASAADRSGMLLVASSSAR